MPQFSGTLNWKTAADAHSTFTLKKTRRLFKVGGGLGGWLNDETKDLAAISAEYLREFLHFFKVFQRLRGQHFCSNNGLHFH